MILKGRYSTLFYAGVLLVGNLMPVLLLLTGEGSTTMLGAAGVCVLTGIYFTEKIWVEAPQRIPLT